MADTERRRRRIRHEPSADAADPAEPSVLAPAAAAQTMPVHDPEVDGGQGAPDHSPPVALAAAGGPSAVPAGGLGGVRAVGGPTGAPGGGPASAVDSHPIVERADDRDVERGLRGLVGAGSSQVSVAAAMRARDAARATDADLAAAESDLVIIRRGWVPRDPLTR